MVLMRDLSDGPHDLGEKTKAGSEIHIVMRPAPFHPRLHEALHTSSGDDTVNLHNPTASSRGNRTCRGGLCEGQVAHRCKSVSLFMSGSRTATSSTRVRQSVSTRAVALSACARRFCQQSIRDVVAEARLSSLNFFSAWLPLLDSCARADFQGRRMSAGRSVRSQYFLSPSSRLSPPQAHGAVVCTTSASLFTLVQ